MWNCSSSTSAACGMLCSQSWSMVRFLGFFIYLLGFLYAVDHNYQAWLKISDSAFCTSFFAIYWVWWWSQVLWLVLYIGRGLRTNSFSVLVYTVYKHSHLTVDLLTPWHVMSCHKFPHIHEERICYIHSSVVSLAYNRRSVCVGR